jgi:hypothetical protein
VSYYFIHSAENGYSAWASYDDGTEEVHVTGLTREHAEREFDRAGQPIRYEDRQGTLDL